MSICSLYQIVSKMKNVVIIPLDENQEVFFMLKFLKKYKAEILVGLGALLAGVMSFFITLSVYPKTKAPVKSEPKVAKDTSITQKSVEEKPKIEVALGEPQMETISQNEISYEGAGELHENGKNTNEENVEIPERDEEFVIAVDYEEEITKQQELNNNESEMREAISQNTEVSIGYPVSGEIILEFAKEKLVYSETLEEWTTHDGVDIKGEVAQPVKAVLAGVVESVKMDPRYGNTIIIKHNDNLKTIYANLSTLDLVYAGKTVEEGEIISGVGEGFGFESKEGPHVHFEVVENGIVREP